VVELVDRMLLADPIARPTIADIHTTLMAIRPAAATTAVLAGPATASTPSAPTRLKGTGLRTAAGRAPSRVPEPGPGRRLVGKLLERRKDTGSS
jgi:hypothetical protein